MPDTSLADLVAAVVALIGAITALLVALGQIVNPPVPTP